jgi:hypothetical protein
MCPCAAGADDLGNSPRLGLLEYLFWRPLLQNDTCVEDGAAVTQRRCICKVMGDEDGRHSPRADKFGQQERGLAGAVRPIDADRLASPHREVGRLNGARRQNWKPIPYANWNEVLAFP